jgi:hypothetical protein
MPDEVTTAPTPPSNFAIVSARTSRVGFEVLEYSYCWLVSNSPKAKLLER